MSSGVQAKQGVSPSFGKFENSTKALSVQVNPLLQKTEKILNIAHKFLSKGTQKELAASLHAVEAQRTELIDKGNAESFSWFSFASLNTLGTGKAADTNPYKNEITKLKLTRDLLEFALNNPGVGFNGKSLQEINHIAERNITNGNVTIEYVVDATCIPKNHHTGFCNNASNTFDSAYLAVGKKDQNATKYSANEASIRFRLSPRIPLINISSSEQNSARQLLGSCSLVPVANNVLDGIEQNATNKTDLHVFYDIGHFTLNVDAFNLDLTTAARLNSSNLPSQFSSDCFSAPSSDSSLSTASIVGISFGSVVGLLVACGAVYVYMTRYRKSSTPFPKKETHEEIRDNPDGTDKEKEGAPTSEVQPAKPDDETSPLTKREKLNKSLRNCWGLFYKNEQGQINGTE